MQENENLWSETEKIIAKEAFKRAYEREISSLINGVQQKAKAITSIEELWILHDFLSFQRHEIEGKYDYRYSVLIFVFAQLIMEGWVELSELEGLTPDKLAKITALSRM